MHGHGVIIYKDGNIYEGQFRDDKRTGYGVYIWTDGKKYEGWWYDSKQHGLGKSYDSNKSSKTKYGLWEHGKRLLWYDPQIVQDIKKKKIMYHEDFEKPNSVHMVERNATFDRPLTFD